MINTNTTKIDNPKDYERYLNIVHQINLLEFTKKELSEQIRNEMESNQVDDYQSEHGKITLAQRTNWQYSKSVDSLKIELSCLQKEEQKNDIAQPVQIKYLRTTLK